MKFVYLIQSIENGFYKIGVSKNPNKRIEKLQTGNSSKLKLIYSYKSDFSDQIEKVLHRKYSHLKKEGEWFDLTLNEEVLFIQECENIQKRILFLKKSENFFI